MKITYLRSSSYNNYDFCQMQYYMSYVLGLPQESNQRADMGTIVHKVMEILGACKKALQENKTQIEDDNFGTLKFNSADIIDKDDNFVDFLIEKCYNHYSELYDHHTWTDSEFASCKEWTYNGLNNYNGAFDPRTRNVFEVEKRFDFCVERDWSKYNYEINGEKIEGHLGLKGTIDMITEIDENTLEVVDYKTGQCKNWATGKRKDLKYFQTKDFQLMFYYYALKHLFPDKDILLTILWLRDGGPFTVSYDDLGKIEKMIKSRYNQIKHCIKPQMIHPQQKDFKCFRLCHYYKNKWPGSNKNMCRYVNDHIKKHGIEKTTEKCIHHEHQIDKYNAPG